MWLWETEVPFLYEIWAKVIPEGSGRSRVGSSLSSIRYINDQLKNPNFKYEPDRSRRWGCRLYPLLHISRVEQLEEAVGLKEGRGYIALHWWICLDQLSWFVSFTRCLWFQMCQNYSWINILSNLLSCEGGKLLLKWWTWLCSVLLNLNCRMPGFSSGITEIFQVLCTPPENHWGTCIEWKSAVYLNIHILFNMLIKPHNLPARQILCILYV